MWYPQRGAFRTGNTRPLVDPFATPSNFKWENVWDKDSIGAFSFSSGVSTMASGLASVSMGALTIASGDYSTSMGYNTIASGDYSTSMGYSTLASGYRSTSMGAFTIASGDYSTSMGYETTASSKYSTSIGYGTVAHAFGSVVIGSFNDSIASSDKFSYSDTNPLFIIGNGSYTVRRNAMVVLKSGRTGLNTNTPEARMHIVGNGLSGARSAQYSNDATLIVEDSGICHIQLVSPSSSPSGILSGTNLANIRSSIIFNADSSISIRTGGNNSRIKIDNDGKIGMGTNFPSEKLHVIGNILASGTITPSDIRYKKDIELIDHPLEKIEEIRGVTYKMKADEFPENGFTDETQAGVIAQEVEAVLPQVVVTDQNGYKAVDYSKIVPLLIEGIKAQQKQIEEVKKENAELKNRMRKLEKK
jgi:hypothetical protein